MHGLVGVFQRFFKHCPPTTTIGEQHCRPHRYFAIVIHLFLHFASPFLPFALNYCNGDDYQPFYAEKILIYFSLSRVILAALIVYIVEVFFLLHFYGPSLHLSRFCAMHTQLIVGGDDVKIQRMFTIHSHV